MVKEACLKPTSLLFPAEESKKQMKIPVQGTFGPADIQATFQALGRDIFFVQVGAMDGVTYDPIHPFVKSLAWRGLLFEPMTYQFEKLKENYKDCPGLIFENRAVADFEGEIEMAYIDPALAGTGVLQDGAFGISTLMQDRGVLGHITPDSEAFSLLKDNTKKVNVPCSRLEPVLRQHNIEKIDLMVVDTEGADWMVVRQLDLLKYQPRIVYFEFYHLSEYEQWAAAMHFRNHGYRVFIDRENSGENFMAVRG